MGSDPTAFGNCGKIADAPSPAPAHEEVRGEQYLTFNPGVIVGGTAVGYDATTSQGTAFGKQNVIAQTVTVDGDLRFISEEQKERATRPWRSRRG